MKNEVGIVLTGTIKPNANFVVLQDMEIRRQQYLRALKFYRQFAPCYFLENSTYDLAKDKDFAAMGDVSIVKCPVSQEYQRGKGYQEFAMLDAFFVADDIPAFMIKVTGRYIIENFSSMLKDCRDRQGAKAMINIRRRRRIADTFLFGIDSAYYRSSIKGFYRLADDARGIYIEHVLYDFFCRRGQDYSLFSEEAVIDGISGSTGEAYARESKWKRKAKNLVRRELIKRNIKTLPW